MRVLLYTFGSRGDIEPLLALALELQTQGAEALVCAPPDFTDLLDAAGVPMVPTGPSVRELVHVQKATAADAPTLAAALVAGQFELLETAGTCDAIVATGLMPAGDALDRRTARRAVPMRDVHPQVLPSPDYRPLPRPGKPFPEGETDNRVLWELDAGKVQALYGPALNEQRKARGLTPIDNVRDHTFTHSPWLACDPVLSRCTRIRVTTSCKPAPGSCPTHDPAAGPGSLPRCRHPTGVCRLRQCDGARGSRPGRHRGDPAAEQAGADRQRLGRPDHDRPGLLRHR